MNIKPVIAYKQIRTARYDKAMLHPVRMYVLKLLSNHICCYSGDLSEELMISKLTLSQHLIELKEAGLIKGEIESTRIRYCINKGNREETKQFQGV